MFNYVLWEEGRCEYVAIGPTDALREGERLFVEIDALPIVLFNIAGQVFAIGDVCSHDDGPVGDGEIDRYEVACPRHGARFDIRTGKALALPAVVDIPAYPVRIKDGMIEVGIPREDVS
jgi:3-phenylpropionate/trans-cinnamate dioxygenase ferredoxin subunit